MIDLLSTSAPHHPRWRGVVIGVSMLVVIGAAIFPFRHFDYELQFLLVLPVVFAGVLAGRNAALATALVAVVIFHTVTRVGSTKVEEDVIAFITFLGSALAVGVAVGSGTDRLSLAREREAEQRRIMELNTQIAEHASRMAVLEQVDQQRVALLRSVSHDLRTPLATIRAVTTDLRESPHDETRRDELLASVAVEAERLDRLVGNLLSMSRIEAGTLRLEDQVVDVAELAELTVIRLGPRLDGVGLDLQIDPALPMINGDPALLDEVLSNLVENAARYAPSGSTVSIELAAAAGPVVVIRVSDHGPGVAVEHREQVFQAFWRGPESRSSGLGLAIVRAVVDAHGGSIAVAETPGGGATFEARLPARDDAVV